MQTKGDEVRKKESEKEEKKTKINNILRRRRRGNEGTRIHHNPEVRPEVPLTNRPPPSICIMAASSVSLWLALSSTSFILVLCSPSSSSFPSRFPPPSTSTDAWSFSYYNYYPSTTPTYAQPPGHAPLGPRELNDHPNDVSRRRSTPPAAPFGHEAFHHRALHSSQDDPARYLHAHALGSWPAQRPYALHHAEVVHDYAHAGE